MQSQKLNNSKRNLTAVKFFLIGLIYLSLASHVLRLTLFFALAVPILFMILDLRHPLTAVRLLLRPA